MDFLGFFKSKNTVTVAHEKQFEDILSGGVLGRPGFATENAESISTFFTCVKILAETLSRLPIGVYRDDPKLGKLKDKEHYLWEILHYNPNGYTTSNAFFNALEVWRNLRGNSYARIYRNKGTGRVQYLELIHPDRVLGHNIVNGELIYRILKPKSTETEDIPSSEILHFKMITKNGIDGLNPVEALRLNLSTTWEGLETINEFYQNSAVTPKAIKSTVSGANGKQMLEAIKILEEKYKGKRGAGGLLPLPPNTEIQELTMNAIDAVFLTMLGFNDSRIGALFGIPGYMIGDTQSSKYNSIEQTQLSFKVNTVSAIARMYRQELEFKLLTSQERRDSRSIEFNLMALVETDHRSRLEGYRILSNIGVTTPNDVARIEGFPTYPGGDDHYIQTNMMSVEQYNKKQSQPKI